MTIYEYITLLYTSYIFPPQSLDLPWLQNLAQNAPLQTLESPKRHYITGEILCPISVKRYFQLISTALLHAVVSGSNQLS